MHLLQAAATWHEKWADIATILGVLGIVFFIIEYNTNKNVRNIQLMHRCIDNFRQWSLKTMPNVDFFYLELLNEELFYFQKRMIQRKVAIEWIEGILDFIQIRGKDKVALNTYNNQTDLELLPEWQMQQMFFARVHYFIYSDLAKSHLIPDIGHHAHRRKKRELAIALYKYIKKYKY